MRERERDHREIDALAADRKRAGNQSEHGAGCGAGQDREFRRKAPHLRRVGRQITRPAEIERVAERQQPDIADQQVERAGEQRETQCLHQEQRIDAEQRRDDKRRDHDQERDQLGAACGRTRGRGERVGNRRHVRPSFRTGQPAGSAAQSP